MNIKQLKETIANLPDDMDVFMGERTTVFAYGLVISTRVKTIPFIEDPSDEITDETPMVDCFILEEE